MSYFSHLDLTSDVLVKAFVIIRYLKKLVDSEIFFFRFTQKSFNLLVFFKLITYKMFFYYILTF